MIPFLDRIADRLLRKFPKGMDGIAVVVPSRRGIVFLREYLSRKIKDPVFLPDFYSIEDFIEKLSGLQVLDNISLQFRLYKAYSSTYQNDALPFDDFLNWGSILLNDFNDIDRNLVDAESIYSNITNVKELENWSIEDWSLSDSSLSSLQSNYVDFFSSMYGCYTSFKENLLQHNLAYQGLAYRTASNNIKNTSLEWSKVWFVGLNALTLSEQEIINYLKEIDVARIFWDADEYYYNNNNHEAGSFLRVQREQWKEIDFKGVGNYYSIPKQSFNVIACPNNICQTKAASELVMNFTKEDLENNHTAIVLADELLLFPLLGNLPSNVKSLNVTMGSPLKNTTLYSFIDLIFTMQINLLKYNKNAFFYKDILDVIEHPYFMKLGEEGYGFSSFIKKENILFINDILINKYFTSKKCIGFFDAWGTTSKAILFLEELLCLLASSTINSKATIESEVLARFNSVMLILTSVIDDADFDISLKTLQSVFSQLVSQEIIPFHGEPLKGLQLMGILETRTLDFKNVIILSVNEGILPKGRTNNSFIPYDIKKYFGLPTYAENDAVFSYHFYRILQRAQNVSLLYNSETDDMGSGERSRFITQLLSEYHFTDIDTMFYNYKDLDLSINSNKSIVIKNEGLLESIKEWSRNGVSPSALNLYKKCSLSFYYRYLAKIRVENQIEEHIDASTIGSIVHNALDMYYPYGILTSDIIKKIRPNIIEKIEKDFQNYFSESKINEGKNYLSLQIAQKLTNDFLAYESKLIVEKEEKKINIVEKEVGLSFCISVEDVVFNLIGNIDRIDIYEEQLRIIDYKTGNVKQDDLIFDDYSELTNKYSKEKAFQLLMYAFLYLSNNPKELNKEVIAGNFSFKNLKDGLIKVAKRSREVGSIPLIINSNVLSQFQDQVEKILFDIMNNDFTHSEDDRLCASCEYNKICNK